MADIVKVGRKGELVLPRQVRASFGLREGDELIVSCDEEAIVLKRKARRFAEYLDGLHHPPSGRERP
jgi:AbrB family looped-hinge helix DNA binding protein